MDHETLSKIFEKFSRADNASKYHAGGSGLGLYVAGEFAKAHKGRVWAESKGEGTGSTFIMEVPTDAIAPHEEKKIKEEKKKHEEGFKNFVENI